MAMVLLWWVFFGAVKTQYDTSWMQLRLTNVRYVNVFLTQLDNEEGLVGQYASLLHSSTLGCRVYWVLRPMIAANTMDGFSN